MFVWIIYGKKFSLAFLRGEGFVYLCGGFGSHDLLRRSLASDEVELNCQVSNVQKSYGVPLF